MRTTQDLIEELHATAEPGIYKTVALVIGFESTTEFVFQSNGTKAEQVEKLNSAIHAGGQPVGILAVKRGSKAGDAGMVVAALFPEHKGDQALMEYMQTLAASFIAQLTGEKQA